MKKPTPPFITPFAIISIIILIGTSNLVVNHVTHTHEGAPVKRTQVVNQQPHSRNNIPQSQQKQKVVPNQRHNLHSESTSNQKSQLRSSNQNRIRRSNSTPASQSRDANERLQK